MTTEQLLWGALTLSFGVIATLVGLWWSSMKQTLADIKETLLKINLRLDNMDMEKVDLKTCEMFHADIKKKIHQHASLGTAGEVIS